MSCMPSRQSKNGCNFNKICIFKPKLHLFDLLRIRTGFVLQLVVQLVVDLLWICCTTAPNW